MKLLFVADPLESFKIYKDTTFAMMREAQRRGHQLAVCEPQQMAWQRGGRVCARVRDIVLTGEAQAWFTAQPVRAAALADFDAVLMRKDPPFDSEYFYATHLLEQAEREGAQVFNKPRALREEGHREAALITFLVTLSGVVVAGVGSAFWGVVAGSLALFVQQYGRDRASNH